MEDPTVRGKKPGWNGSATRPLRAEGRPSLEPVSADEIREGAERTGADAAYPDAEKDDRGFLDDLETTWSGLRMQEEDPPVRSQVGALAPVPDGVAAPSGKAAALTEALEAAAEVLRRHGQHDMARWAAEGAFEIDRLGRRIDVDVLLEELGGVGGRAPRLLLAALLGGAFAVGREAREPAPTELHRHLM